MKKDRIYIYGLALIASFIISLLFDVIISKSITSLRFDALSSIMLIFISSIFMTAVLAGASILVFLQNKKKVLYLWLSIVSGLVVSIALKIIIARPRPFVNGISTLSSLVQSSYTKWDFSFPSDHAVFAFAMLPFIPKKWFWPWLIISILIAFSRVYFGLHYLSDVIAGASIGLLSAYLFNKIKDG